MKELVGLARLAAYGLGGGAVLLSLGSLFHSIGFGDLGELLVIVTVAGICLLRR